jgi:hypothetical protein
MVDFCSAPNGQRNQRGSSVAILSDPDATAGWNNSRSPSAGSRLTALALVAALSMLGSDWRLRLGISTNGK